MLVLVGGEDLLISVRDTGKFRGADVFELLDALLEKLVAIAAGKATKERELELYVHCIICLRKGRKAANITKWLTRILWAAVIFAGLVYVTFYMDGPRQGSYPTPRAGGYAPRGPAAPVGAGAHQGIKGGWDDPDWDID